MEERRLKGRWLRIPSQSSLFRNSETPSTDRLFFAIFLNEDVAERTLQTAECLRSQHALKGRPLPAARLHVSLHHLGDHAGLPQEIIAAARAAASTVAASQFGVGFDRATSFARRRSKCPFVLLGGDGVVALTSFQQRLGIAMAEVGLGRFVHSNYTPHMTLLYDGHFVSEQTIEPIHWTVRDFVLVHSLLGQTKHVRLGQWTLRGNTAVN